MTDEKFTPDPELIKRLERIRRRMFYVLTPQIMERMAEFGRRYPRLVFHVTDGKMYVGVDQIARDAFEVDLHKPLDYNRIRGNISIDVQVIKDLIDVMKIDNQKMDSINYE